MTVADLSHISSVIIPVLSDRKAVQLCDIGIILYFNEIHISLIGSYDCVRRNYLIIDCHGKTILTVNDPLEFVPAGAALYVSCSKSVIIISISFYSCSVMCLCHAVHKCRNAAVIEYTKRSIIIIVDAKSEFCLGRAAVCIIVPCCDSDIAHRININGRRTG